MAEILPLPGIRYSLQKVGDLDRVIAPPYDVISPKEQDLLYRKSPYNIIRLEKPRQEPGDEGDERYQRAANQYRWWLKSGVLVREDKPSLYLYEEGFPGDEGGVRVRRGLVCGVKLSPYGERVVLPHEETMEKPKEDRLKLMRSCRANFSPLFSLYAAKEGEDPLPTLLAPFREAVPVIDFQDSRGYSHRVWAVSDEAVIREVADFFKDRQIFMADGHHRYETALTYHEELGRPGGRAAYVMMNLVNTYDPGLVVLPTHRLVRKVGAAADVGGKVKVTGTGTGKATGTGHGNATGAGNVSDTGNVSGAGNATGTGQGNVNVKNLLSALEDTFSIEERSYGSAEEVCERGMKDLGPGGDRGAAGERGAAIGLFAGAGQFFLLRLRDEAAGKKDEIQKLDAILLQDEVLEKALGIDAAKRHQGDYLGYTRDCREAVNEVLQGSSRMAFLLNPTPAEAVIKAAAAGIKMPQKSTYFFPKLTAGLIINPLE